VLKFIPQGMGWIPDVPDPRDYTIRHEDVLARLRQFNAMPSELPDKVDLRQGDEGETFFTDSEGQGPLNSSTAFAVHGLVEFFARREGRTFNASKLFLYKVARNLRHNSVGICADTGMDLRTTIKALIQFGLPPEELWPYERSRANEEPPSFVYAATKSLESFRYFRILPTLCSDIHRSGSQEERLSSPWDCIQSILTTGLPFAFGFPLPKSLTYDSNIPFRPEFDSYHGGIAALAIGYDSNRYGRNRGAVLVRTSLGREWGDNGNGWLPASYFDFGLATDLWALVKHPRATGLRE